MLSMHAFNTTCYDSIHEKGVQSQTLLSHEYNHCVRSLRYEHRFQAS